MNAPGEDVAQESEPAKSVSTAAELSEQTFELEPEDGVTVTLKGLMPTDGYAEAKKADVDEEDVLHAYFDEYGNKAPTYEMKNIKYEQPLSAYEHAYVPGTRNHYTFTGWFEDKTCTKPFKFDKEIWQKSLCGD